MSILLTSLWVLAAGHLVPPSQSVCIQMFQSKEYKQACQCFERLLAHRSNTKDLSEKEKIVWGRRLRNAAIAYQFAAKEEKGFEAAAYLRERGARLLQRYIKRRLYENRYRMQSAMALQFRLQKQVGYAPLTILASQPKARIFIRGYRFREQGLGRWSMNVRPGRYHVRVLYPTSKQAHLRTLTILPKQPKAIVVKPRVKSRVVLHRPTEIAIVRRTMPPAASTKTLRRRKTMRVVALTLLGVGLAGVGVGATLYTVGRVKDGDRVAYHQQVLLRRPSEIDISDTKKIHDLGQEASVLMLAGVVFLSVGGGVGLLGGGLLLAKK